jgi:hypothetical protein
MHGPAIFGWLFLAGGALFALQAISTLIGEVIASRTWPRVTARVVSRDAEQVGQTEYGEPLWFVTVRFDQTTLQLDDTRSEKESRVGTKIELVHPPGEPSRAQVAKGRAGAAVLQLVVALACVAIGLFLRH